MKFSIHKTQRRMKAMALAAACVTGGLLTGGCADETFNPDTEGMPGVLTVTLTDTGTRADLPMQESTEAERTVNHLQLFAFPVDGEGEFASFVLDNPTPNGMLSGRTYRIEELKDGRYRIYIVGNMESELRDVDTEDKLKAVIIDHEGKLEGQYRLADGTMNLPMVYEPTEQKDSPDGVVTIDNLRGPRLTTPLKFACVKIAYRILFDNSAEIEGFNKEPGTKPFGSNGFLIKNVKAGSLTAATSLVLDNDHTADVTLMDCATPSYCKYWTENTSAASQDVIAPSNPTAEIDLSGRYYCRGTIYLPERYRVGMDDRAFLEFSGNQTSPGTKLTYGTDISSVAANGPEAVYTIRLGQRDDDGTSYDDAEGATYSLDRGTYYEVIGRVRKAQSQQIEAEVNVRDWTPHNMAGDLSHTTLEVDRTRLSIASLQPDSVAYVSNAAEITVGSDDTEHMYNGNHIITRYTSEGDGKGPEWIRLRINAAIPYSAFGEGEGKIPPVGTTRVYIQAGNIRKYIDVDYNVSPIFDVNPASAIIAWLGDNQDSEHTRTFRYRTNLGGAVLPGIESGSRYDVAADGSLVKSASGVLQISYGAISDSEGIVTVVAKNKPDETNSFIIPLSPVMPGYDYLSTSVSVAVKPPYDTYRIYFRPINDNQEDVFGDYSGSIPDYFSGWKVEGANLIYYYLYTQMGETEPDGNGGFNIPKDMVWLFNGSWPGKLSAASSGGWYRYDLPKSSQGICQAGDDGTVKYPKPGETLIIFNTNDAGGRHRMAHAGDPGIQLYDYEDGEGYYIFDPMCDPYYKVFDDRPEIEKVRYRIFCKDAQPTEFYITYGGKENKDFTLRKTLDASRQSDKAGAQWWVADFYAQAPAGNYAKQVKVKFSNGKESVLFGGENFYNASNPGISRGIYDAATGSWTMGAPELTGAEATTTIRIWAHVPGMTAAPKIYAWSGSVNNGVWPGVTMQKSTTSGYSDWYYADIAKGRFSNCIINMGSGSDQSSNLTISSSAVQGWKRNSAGNYTSISSGWPDK